MTKKCTTWLGWCLASPSNHDLTRVSGPGASRQIDLWTGVRPNVFGNDPEFGFVIQEGTEPPPPDSVVVPGSPIILMRGEPTEIVVHNRLPHPLSVHWQWA